MGGQAVELTACPRSITDIQAEVLKGTPFSI